MKLLKTETLKGYLSVDISFGCIFARYYAARITQDNGMAGDIAVHICPRGDEDVVTDCNTSDDGGVYADPHTVSQNWRAFSLAAVLLTDCHALMQIAVRADNGGLIHRDVEGMPEVEPRSDFSGASYLQAISLLQTMKQQTPNEIARAMRLAEGEEESERMIGQRRSVCSITAPIEAPPPPRKTLSSRQSLPFNLLGQNAITAGALSLLRQVRVNPLAEVPLLLPTHVLCVDKLVQMLVPVLLYRPDWPRRDTGDDCVVGNVMRYDGAGAHDAVSADSNARHDHGVHPDVRVVAD